MDSLPLFSSPRHRTSSAPARGTAPTRGTAPAADIDSDTCTPHQDRTTDPVGTKLTLQPGQRYQSLTPPRLYANSDSPRNNLLRRENYRSPHPDCKYLVDGTSPWFTCVYLWVGAESLSVPIRTGRGRPQRPLAPVSHQRRQGPRNLLY